MYAGYLLVAVPVLAQTYTAEINLEETAGTSYTMMPVLMPLDTNEMVDDIVALLTDPIRLDQYGVQARKAVHNNYSHWNAALRLEELIQRASVESVVTP